MYDIIVLKYFFIIIYQSSSYHHLHQNYRYTATTTTPPYNAAAAAPMYPHSHYLVGIFTIVQQEVLRLPQSVFNKQRFYLHFVYVHL